MTEKSLDRILAQCLEEAERTGDIGAILKDHPEHAHELLPLLELASVARRIYADVPPPPGGLAWGRARLLSQARQARSLARADDRAVPGRERGSPVLSRLAAAFIGAGVTVAIIAFVVVGVTRAANEAVPGHPLYGLDRALEQLWVGLSSDPASVAKLRLRLAKERLGEVAQLARANEQVHLQEGLESYGDAVVALAQMSGAGSGTGDPEAISELDRVLASHEEQLEAALEGVDGSGEEDTVQSRWCAGQGTHPLADGLARCYAIDTDTVRHWYCDDRYSFGEIVHALQMGEAVGGTDGLDDKADALLALKTHLGGWGQVWQASGLIGRPDEPALSDPTRTPEPPGQTSTPRPPAQEQKPESVVQTQTPRPPGQTSTPQLPAQGQKPQSSGPTSTPQLPTQEQKPQSSGPTSTPKPPGPTSTPEPPG